MGRPTAKKYPVPDRVKPSLVIFDIRALWRSGHQMLYSCTHMATVGVKGLNVGLWGIICRLLLWGHLAVHVLVSMADVGAEWQCVSVCSTVVTRSREGQIQKAAVCNDQLLASAIIHFAEHVRDVQITGDTMSLAWLTTNDWVAPLLNKA